METSFIPLDKSSVRVGKRFLYRRHSANAPPTPKKKKKDKLTKISSANFADAREVWHHCAESRSIHEQVLIHHGKDMGKKLGISRLHLSMGAEDQMLPSRDYGVFMVDPAFK